MENRVKPSTSCFFTLRVPLACRLHASLNVLGIRTSGVYFERVNLTKRGWATRSKRGSLLNPFWAVRGVKPRALKRLRDPFILKEINVKNRD